MRHLSLFEPQRRYLPKRQIKSINDSATGKLINKVVDVNEYVLSNKMNWTKLPKQYNKNVIIYKINYDDDKCVILKDHTKLIYSHQNISFKTNYKALSIDNIHDQNHRMSNKGNCFRVGK